MGQNLVPIDIAAEDLGVHPSTIYRWVKQTIEGELDVPFSFFRVDQDGVPKPPWYFEMRHLREWFADYMGTPRRGWRPGMGR